MNTKRFILLIVGLFILLFSSGCALLASKSAPPDTVAPAATAVPAVPVVQAISLGDFSTAIRQVSQQVRPAVVQITNEQTVMTRSNQAYTVPAGVGSGVLYDQQGHILTNAHVVSGAQQLLVSLPDGRSFTAKSIGADTQTDLAVVQISGTNLPVAKLGDSNQLQVGDWVVAIGNALALPGGPTVTAGVVSALGRTVEEPADDNSNLPGPYLFDVIQTSAPINPGNSGGALVNLNGEVIGINTMVAGQAEPGVEAQGIGFAISMTAAKPIADQLVATGHVVHPYLGISAQSITPAISRRIGVTATNGQVVVSVDASSPAAKAGLRQLDVITEIDGQALQDDSDMQSLLNQKKPGDTVTLTVIRGQQKMSVKVTLTDTPK